MNRFLNAGAVLNQTPQDLFVCPNNSHAVIHTLFVSRTNMDEDAKRYVTVQVYDASRNVTYTLAYMIEILTHATLSFDKPINLDANDILKVSSNVDSSNGDDVQAFASILHIVPMSL
jgi:hypothetical protein